MDSFKIAEFADVATFEPGDGEIGRPQIGSPEWNNYVLSQFTEDEVFNGNPKVGGLRRVARKLLGPIIFSGPEKISKKIPVSVVYRVRFLWSVPEDLPDGGHAYEVDILATADCSVLNTMPEYLKFALTTAETRAEARCYRKALQLQTVAAEELSNLPPESPERITSSQIDFINVIAKRSGISLEKCLKAGKTKYTNLEDMPYEVADEFAKRLSEWQNDPTKIPDSVKAKEQA